MSDEIEYFVSNGRSSNIIPVIADGEPEFCHQKFAKKGAFPPTLRSRGGSTPEVPLAPDIRNAEESSSGRGDGFEVGVLRIVAGILGISYPELTQRHLVAERQKRRKRNYIIVTLTALLVIEIAASVAAWRQKQTAELHLAQAIGSAARQATLATRLRDRYGVPSSLSEELFTGAEKDFLQYWKTQGRRQPLFWSVANTALAWLSYPQI